MRAPAESTRYTTGSSCRSACSVSRTIFSTVRAPHEPAFTVGSFAITHTGRPSIRPTPVTTPSAGRSPASAFASSASSTNEPASSSSASRSRTNSLFCDASFSASLARLPCCARAACSASRSYWSGPFVVTTRTAASAGRRAAARSAARGRRCPARARAQPINASRSMPVSMPMSSQHVHEILGDRVARRAGRVRTAAEPADRRVEASDAAFERGDARWPARCRACRGSAGRRGRPRCRRVRARRGGRRRVGASPCRWCRRTRGGRRLRRRGDRRSARPARGATSPSYGQPNAVDTIASATMSGPVPRARRRHARRSSESATDRRTFFWLCVSLALTTSSSSSAFAAIARSAPLGFGTSAE